MIALRSTAPDFALPNQNGSLFRLSDFRGRSHVLLLFIPAAFTPVCSTEVPALEKFRSRFWNDASTAVAVITADNSPSNREWARRCKAEKLFMLSDYEPKGTVSQAYGAWMAADGIPARATVIIDRNGVVRYAEDVGKFGKRSVPALLNIARAIDGKGPLEQQSAKMPLDLPVMFTMADCPYCSAAKDLIRALHLEDRIVMRTVDTDPAALELLLSVNPTGGVPTLAYLGKTYVGPQAIGVQLKNIAKKVA
jgi:peroxiredoxin/glutaredoxin